MLAGILAWHVHIQICPILTGKSSQHTLGMPWKILIGCRALTCRTLRSAVQRPNLLDRQWWQHFAASDSGSVWDADNHHSWPRWSHWPHDCCPWAAWFGISPYDRSSKVLGTTLMRPGIFPHISVWGLRIEITGHRSSWVSWISSKLFAGTCFHKFQRLSSYFFNKQITTILLWTLNAEMDWHGRFGPQQ